MNQVKCEYCGRVREDGQIMFCIGASKDPDWVMNEGTGKMSCPDCHDRGREDGAQAIDQATRGGLRR